MDNCIFCKIVKGEAGSWKVFEDEHTFAFLDINPKTKYHTIVIPKKHYVNMFDIPIDELLYVMRTVKRVINLYAEKLGLENVQVINNSGADAQQDVFHLHYHIVPRFKDDGKNLKLPPVQVEWREKFDEMLSALK